MNHSPERPDDRTKGEQRPTTAACPVCGGRLVEVRAKLQCSRCRTICETCCEGGRG
jgi:hypothetical protein